MSQYDAIIIGAGAAGLMCALTAGQRGRKVLLLDRNSEVGSKILISGGGRCNFTNIGVVPGRFISSNPHFCISALKTYTQHDFITLVRKHKIPFHEKTLGQLFCDGSAREIIAMLLEECRAGQVEIHNRQDILEITKSEKFTVRTESGTYQAAALVLATGGLSIPKMGATDFTHQTAKKFGLPVTETLPGLVPLAFGGSELSLMSALSGLSLETVASCGKQSFKEAMVFTHRGLSGPAILQISSYWRAGQEITLDLLPGTDASAFLLDRKKSRPKAELQTILAELMPQRLASSLVATYATSQPMTAFTDKSLKEFAALLKAWRLKPVGTEGYAKAEVTLGGVDTRALSSKTMQANEVQGLYVIGEAVDVTGWLGGYNFQWAWSSGYAAGTAI